MFSIIGSETMRLLATCALALLSTVATAQETPIAWTDAMNNLSHEYAQCGAYFLVVSVAMENSKQPALAGQYRSVSEKALEFALIYAREAELLPEATNARFEMEFVTMSKRIAGNTSNIAILGNDYAALCQTAMEDTNSRLEFWTSQKMPDQ